MTDELNQPRVTLATLQDMQRRGEKIASLTCYDSSFTLLLEAAGIDVFIIGDSLGMVLKGHETTVPVTMADMLYHAANVARVGRHAYRVVDMPYMSYTNPDQALANAARLMGEGGADMVKLEGGTSMAAAVEEIVSHGIPVCGHIGLLPQSIEQLGGYKVQGRDAAAAAALLEDARSLEEAGAALLVMECIPAALAEQITAALSIPTIGIGAGPGCDGQVLVLYDMLGITPGKPATFVKDFLEETGTIHAAVEAYVRSVKDGSYPAPEHCF
ncbi:MAG: 3-methyl-2-oxobutanoate hydroxymethyltransferase [Gammaproteobacteria bacterium]|nr:MAG: 3-methyl-2-oxobutanoate hydroxymethyltransferase [Gammaproteobacteria bacterium]